MIFTQQPRPYGAREIGTGRREPWERDCLFKSVEVFHFFYLTLHPTLRLAGLIFVVFEPIQGFVRTPLDSKWVAFATRVLLIFGGLCNRFFPASRGL